MSFWRLRAREGVILVNRVGVNPFLLALPATFGKLYRANAHGGSPDIVATFFAPLFTGATLRGTLIHQSQASPKVK